MKFLSLDFSTLILRFYLLMAIVIIAFFSGYTWLALLSLPVFFSALMGIRFTMPRLKSQHKIYSAFFNRSRRRETAH